MWVENGANRTLTATRVAGALMRIVTSRILQRGETAFLHARAAHVETIAFYETLGFRPRALIDYRVLAAVGSGVGATVIVGGAVYSAVRFAKDRNAPGHARQAGANTLIALGTLVLSSGGLVQGAVGHDEAFTATLAIGITVIYSGFLLAATRGNEARVLQTTAG